MIQDVSIAILAGGQSRRMGTDKSFVAVDGKPMVERVLGQVQTLDLPIFIITNQPDHYRYLQLPIFTDVITHKGSLGGLYSALYYSKTPYTLCVACDMPFLVPELLRHIIQIRHEYDAVVPEVNRYLQPLHAVYSAACMKPLYEQLQNNNLAIYDLFHRLNTRIVSQSALMQFDPDLRSFINVNTPDDLDFVLHQIERCHP